LTVDDCRRALRSDARIVAVEAAAGCGKTYEAAALATDLACQVRAGQEVLLLAHTHAAINVFRDRVRARTRVRVMTLDAFAHELVGPYAAALGLPVPLRPGRKNGVPYERLAPALNELLRRAPAIRQALAKHYPAILLDEHQDARRAHHAVAVVLASAGSRIRFFGDPMQAIFDFGRTPAADWTALAADAEVVKQLLTPRRWPEAPRLGDWLTEARAELLGGRALPPLVPEVRLSRINADAEPNPMSTAAPVEVARPVFRLLNELRGSIGILVRTHHQAVVLRRALARCVPIFEGRAALDRAGALIEEVIEHVDNPQALAEKAIEVLQRYSAGVTEAIRRMVGRCLRSDRIDRGRQKKLAPLFDQLETIYREPTVSRWCAVMGALVKSPPPGIKLDGVGALHALGRLRACPDADLADAVAELTHKLALRRPVGRCISTIHMAKGDEFDHVIVPHFGRQSFRDRLDERRLLYVALTRARRSIHLLAPRSATSPLETGKLPPQVTLPFPS
jgi:superfamily I DNA/RNA helicase